jgi:hypothetical protein
MTVTNPYYVQPLLSSPRDVFHADGWTAVALLGTALPVLALLHWATEFRDRTGVAENA